MTAKLLLLLAFCGASAAWSPGARRLDEVSAELVPPDGPDPPPPKTDDGGDDGDDGGPPCASPPGCPCLYGALDTFFDDDVSAQPQLQGDGVTPYKRPKYLADIMYPLRGGQDFIPVPIFMNGATSLDGFEAKVAGTGKQTKKSSLSYDGGDAGEAGFTLHFAKSSGIRTRNFEYELIDTTGTCPASVVAKRADVYPKWMAFLPIMVLLTLAILTQDVFISMAAGCWIARWLLERDGWIGMLRFLDTDLPEGMKTMAPVILFAWLLGGVIGAANRSGGMEALGPIIVKYIKDSTLSQIVVYLFGFVVFMDDYGNTLIVGNTVRPVTDMMRLSREKLAFLVDCTSAPIASLTPLSTWVAYELGLIKQNLDAVGYDQESAFTLFIDSIPKRFYSWFMLIMVLGSILLSRDFGPMWTAEQRARRGDGLVPPDPKKEGLEGEDEEGEPLEMGVKPKKGIPQRARNALLPFLGLVAAFIPLLFYSGARQAPWGGMGWDASTRNLMGNADPYGCLLWLGAFAIIFQVVLYAAQYSREWGGCLLTPSETVAAAVEGTKDLVEASIVLIFASAIGKLSQMVMLPDVVVDLIGDSIGGPYLPAVVFLISGFIALATGSSWTTMAIVFPIAIPLGNAASGGSTTKILTNVIAAVLGGATWGDHCSPISDTTVLSAAACRCPTIEHVKTQIPYALLAGFCAVTLGFLLNGQGIPAVVLILCAIIFMPAIFYGVTLVWGGPTGIYNPEVDAITGEGHTGTLASLKAFFKGEHAPAEERLAKKYSSKMFEVADEAPGSARVSVELSEDA